MLDPFIIEEIRRREQAERDAQERQRPALEIPSEMPYWPPSGTQPEKPSEERGVIVIDF